jgi:RNA methyltransferase, TrmH family
MAQFLHARAARYLRRLQDLRVTSVVRQITSAENPRYKTLLRLQRSSRERRRAGLTLLDGAHLVETYLRHVGEPQTLIVSRSGLAKAEVQRLLEHTNAERLALADGLFAALSSLASPSGILAVVRTPPPAGLPEVPDACIMLEDVQDPGNVGSILRSAAAGGLMEVYLSPGCAQAWSPRVLRAGMGAHFVLRIHEGAELALLIRRCRGPVFALGLRGRPHHDVDLTGRVALLFGSEGTGLSEHLQESAHLRLTIPMPGAVESLNVAAAVAVCVFERARQRAQAEAPPQTDAWR